MDDTERRRSVVDLTATQAEQVTTGDAAGGSIYHGPDPDGVLAFFREYAFKADQARETAIKEVAHELRRVQGDMGVISDALRALRERANAEDRERDARRGDLDATLGELTEAVSALAEEQAHHRRQLGLVALGLAALAGLWVVGLVVLAWLIYDRITAAALLRVLAGAAAALAFGRQGDLTP